MSKKIAIIGGGAGGFFTAINTAIKNPDYQITIFEKGKNVLGKVKVSGGGRCNVTHACFEPKELVKFYPRGQKELLGPFHTFMTGDTFEWFAERDINIKIEDDGRCFPDTDRSQTIIDCFLKEARDLGIKIRMEYRISEFKPQGDKWLVDNMEYDALVVAAGGNASDIWENLVALDYEIIPPIPSLFTFNTKDTRLRDLSGLSVPRAEVKIAGTKRSEIGPLLITHWGMSGPAILKLSAVGARDLHNQDYKFNILVDWCFEHDREDVEKEFENYRYAHSKKTVLKSYLFELPKRLWESLVLDCKIPESKTWAELSKKDQNKLLENLKAGSFQIGGKSTNKEEFVTCGGVDLKQVNFQKFESRKHPNLYFVGEVLNIDALTGGFNFQAAWTGGYIVSQNI
ncbi:MAG: putative Rossmann fold flavoprotein [Parvicella sp.]|jgi:predicted Rossmann fold flavoprotein